MVDYKFRHIIRDGKTVRCRVAFYEGAITTESELTSAGNRDITRYRRSKFLGEQDFTFLGDKTDVELRASFNSELLKKGEPIAEQK